MSRSDLDAGQLRMRYPAFFIVFLLRLFLPLLPQVPVAQFVKYSLVDVTVQGADTYPRSKRVLPGRRWSKGIKKPDVSVVEYKKAKEKASSGKLTFTKTVALEDPESDFKNTLQYEYYNSMRK